MDSYVLVQQALKDIHRHSFKNREEIQSSVLCHCFACKEASASSHVTEWADDGDTALCPRCGIDSVIGDASGFEMTPALLQQMSTFWFEDKFIGSNFDWGLLSDDEE